MSRTRDCQSCTEVRGQRSSWLCKRATSRAKAPAGEPWAMGRCVGVALTDLLDAICERLQRRSRGNDGECFRKGRFGQQQISLVCCVTFPSSKASARTGVTACERVGEKTRPSTHGTSCRTESASL